MNVQILHVAEAVAREKGVDRELVIDAMEQALKTAARRTHDSKHVEVSINRDTGESRLVHVRTVVEEVEDPENELTLEEAQALQADAELGTMFETLLPPVALGRIEAQTAKQVLNQKIREAERQRIVAEFEPRVGELISGIVKRVERGNVYIDLGRGEAVLYREDLLPRESFRQGDRVRAFLREVRNQSKGALIYLSRADAGMVLRLFEQEVPEIQDGLVEIQAIARDPGSRTKIAVVSSDAAVDPVGACVGMRGARVQAVVNELHGERVDIISWSEDPAAFVVSALAPAEVDRVIVDEENETIEVAVSDEQLAIAIGRRGQNVRLASALTGWNIEVMSSGEANQKHEAEVETAKKAFMESLGLNETMSMLLIAEGFLSLEDIAYCGLQELSALEGVDETLAQEMQTKARDALLTIALSADSDDELAAKSVALLDVPGMQEDIALLLLDHDVRTAEALADASVDDLGFLEGMQRAQVESLILSAREACGWFE